MKICTEEIFNMSSQFLCVLSYENHTFLVSFSLSFYAHLEYHLPLEVVNNFSNFWLNSHQFFYAYLCSHPLTSSITRRGRSPIRKKHMQGIARSKGIWTPDTHHLSFSLLLHQRRRVELCGLFLCKIAISPKAYLKAGIFSSNFSLFLLITPLCFSSFPL